MISVNKEKLIDFGIKFLTVRGVPENNARSVSEIVVETEAMGVHTHGLTLFSYFDMVIPEELNPKSKPLLVKEGGAAALIDGNSSFGQLAMKMAGEIAEKKAKAQGVAMVGISNCLWAGAIGIYLVSLAKKGFLAQLWTQTSTCKDCAPFGGVDAKFSTNPVALAFPTDNDPMISDFSTASMSLGKAKKMAKSGQRAPEPAFMDKDGNIGNDPTVIDDGGSLLFFGGQNYGYKGYALSLWCEALTALAGGDCNNPEAKTRQSMNLTVIDPDAFAGNDYYYTEMKRFIGHMKQSRVRQGFDEVRLPGERRFQSLDESKTKGVEVDESMIDTLNGLAEKYAIPGV